MSDRLKSGALASRRRLVCAAIFVAATPVAVRAQPPYLVKDVNPITGGPGNGHYANVAVAGNILFFQGCQLTSGCELWKSDGTPAGTVLVKEIYPGSGSYPFNVVTSVGGTLYFAANDVTNGVELWCAASSGGSPELVGASVPLHNLLRRALAAAAVPLVVGLAALGI